jgi:hypothetical protein
LRPRLRRYHHAGGLGVPSAVARSELDRERRRSRYEARLRELGEVTFARIEVAPFVVERFGTTFGLIARPGNDEDDAWWVELRPGNYMAFTEPWDSGKYDT